MAKNQSIEQSILIKRLKAYFNEHNIPLEVNDDGICNGLATIHAKYILESKETEFKDMLNMISGKTNISDDDDAKIAKFSAHVLMAFDPERTGIYNQNQGDSYKLWDNEKPIHSLFSLGLVTNKKSWKKIINNINLQDDEVMLVGSANHAISIVKNQGEYKVYDPNNDELYATFNNEAELVNYLKTVTFRYASDLGLRINVVSHKEKRADEHPFPSLDDIYKVNQSTQAAKTGNSKIDSLQLCCKVDKADAMQALLENNNQFSITQLQSAAKSAAKRGNTSILNLLLAIISKKNELNEESKKVFYKELVTISLLSGKKEAFELLKTNDNAKDTVNQIIDDYGYSGILFLTCKGGNPEMVATLLEQKDDVSEIQHSSKSVFIIINAAVESHNHTTVGKILSAFPLNNEAKKIELLTKAIEQNSPLVFNELLTFFSNDNSIDLSPINLHLSAVRKTDITILNKLQRNGVNFDKEAQAIIDEKNNISIGIIQKFGITLTRFTEFLKRQLLNEKAVGFDLVKMTNAENSPDEEEQKSCQVDSDRKVQPTIDIQFDSDDDHEDSSFNQIKKFNKSLEITHQFKARSAQFFQSTLGERQHTKPEPATGIQLSTK